MSNNIIVPGRPQPPPPGKVSIGVNGEIIGVLVGYDNIGQMQIMMNIEEAKGFATNINDAILKAEEARLKARLNMPISPGELRVTG